MTCVDRALMFFHAVALVFVFVYDFKLPDGKKEEIYIHSIVLYILILLMNLTSFLRLSPSVTLSITKIILLGLVYGYRP